MLVGFIVYVIFRPINLHSNVMWYTWLLLNQNINEKQVMTMLALYTGVFVTFKLQSISQDLQHLLMQQACLLLIFWTPRP